MILQVIFDDQFGNYAIEQFRDYPEIVRFVVVKYSPNEQLMYLKNISDENILVYRSNEYNELLANLSKYKAVIMHGLFSQAQFDIVRHLPKETKLAWVLWGGEIYYPENTSLFRLAPITRLISKIKLYKDKLYGIRPVSSKVPMEILRRVDYMLGSSIELYDVVREFTGNTNIQHLMYFYFTLESLIGEDSLNKTINGNNILLGNSAALENNHFDIMLHLKRIGLPKNIRLITPLSYSTPWVKIWANKIGKILFGNQFYPLLSFIPRPEYNKLVQSCSVFIANHHNPNAFGNVLTSLWLGARVYVSKHNVQTKFLQRLGLHVNVIETDLNRKNPNLYQPLSDKERDENRAIIHKMYGREQMRKNIENIVSTLGS